MLGDKSEHFEGKGTNLTDLESHLTQYLENDGFTVQTSPPSDQGNGHPGKKGGFLRDVVRPSEPSRSPSPGPESTSRCDSASASGSRISASPPSRRC